MRSGARASDPVTITHQARGLILACLVGLTGCVESRSAPEKAPDGAQPPQAAGLETTAQPLQSVPGNAPASSSAAPAERPEASMEGRAQALQALETSLASDLPPGPNTDPKLETELMEFEKTNWEGFKQGNPELFQKHTAVVAISVRSDGTRMTRNASIDELKKASFKDYQLSNVRLIKLGSESALITYHAHITFPDDSKSLFASTSVWQKTDKGWKARFHQDTPVRAALTLLPAQGTEAEGAMGMPILPPGVAPVPPPEGAPAPGQGGAVPPGQGAPSPSGPTLQRVILPAKADGPPK